MSKTLGTSLITNPPQQTLKLRDAWIFSALHHVSVDTIRDSERTCGICLEWDFTGDEVGNKEYGHIPVRSTCNHVYCQDCIVRWLSLGRPNAAVSWPEVHRFLLRREDYEPEGPGLWGRREKEKFMEAVWLSEGLVAADQLQSDDPWDERHIKNNDKCPLCRMKLVPWIFEVVVVDAEKALAELPLLLQYFCRLREPKRAAAMFKKAQKQRTVSECRGGTLPPKARGMLEATISVALMTLHGRMLLSKDLEVTMRAAVLEGLEELDWYLWALPEVNDRKKVQDYKALISLFLRFFASQVLNDMPRIPIKPRS